MPKLVLVPSSFVLSVATFAVGAALAACGGGAPAAKAPSAGAAPKSATEQVAIGAKSYGDNCSSCHGDKGEGDADSPVLVGSSALPEAPPKDSKLRSTKFVTAQDVFEFSKAQMPKGGIGSVSDDEIWAITAWTLKENGVQWGDALLGPANAKEIKLRK
jgi:cytochrome c